MNKVFLMGRLTKDPDIKEITNRSGEQTKIAKFSLAVDRKMDKDVTDYFNCVAFGKVAGIIENYVGKGKRIVVIGRVQTDSYTNKDGQKAYYTQIVLDEMEFADTKKEIIEMKTSPDFMDIPEGIEDSLPFK